MPKNVVQVAQAHCLNAPPIPQFSLELDVCGLMYLALPTDLPLMPWVQHFCDEGFGHEVRHVFLIIVFLGLIFTFYERQSYLMDRNL